MQMQMTAGDYALCGTSFVWKCMFEAQIVSAPGEASSDAEYLCL